MVSVDDYGQLFVTGVSGSVVSVDDKDQFMTGGSVMVWSV